MFQIDWEDAFLSALGVRMPEGTVESVTEIVFPVCDFPVPDHPVILGGD